jgi:carbamoyl-phosphate synthase large subunit
MNILITSVSHKVSLVRAFQDALATAGGGIVFAVDSSAYSPALYVADRFELVPRSAEPTFAERLLELCVEQHVELLVPTRDEELPLFAGESGRFASVGTRVMVASSETIRICQDKVAFQEFCEAHGLPIPQLVRDYATAAYPLFVKPRWGKGGRGTTRVDTEAELRSVVARLGNEAVVQRLSDAPEYTVDLFADFDGNVISVVPRERILVLGGESFVSRAVHSPELRDTAIAAARALGLIGHNTIQCFLRDGHAELIEINPRFGGAAALGFAAGANSSSCLVRLLKGERLEPRVDEFTQGLVMLRYSQDMFLEADRFEDRG